MPFLLRSVKRRHWLTRGENPTDPGLQGIPQNERPAEVYQDLCDKTGNELSVWYVTDEMDNLEDVVTAIATTRDTIELVDYVLLQYTDVERVCPIAASSGETAYGRANHWHRDLRHVCARQLATIACDLSIQLGRKNYSQVNDLLRRRAASGELQSDILRESLRAKLFSAG